MAAVDSVIFDIGNVLIDWDPRHLYKTLIADEAERERFLSEVCTPAWNLEQDRGRPWPEAVAERVALFPQHEALIRAYDERWSDMVPGTIAGVPEILERLAKADVLLYAITNFSSAKFDVARRRFPFLNLFKDVTVSGEVKILKPDPAIFHMTLERNGLDPARTLFIDDSPKNVEGAEAVGLKAHLFRDAETLERELKELGLPI